MAEGAILHRFRTWCVLLLVTILAHALLPIGTPAARQSGSPFSAATVEVSTGPGRKIAATETIRTDFDPDDRKQAPTVGTSLPLAVPPPLPILALAKPVADWFASPEDLRSRCADRCTLPRGPPLA